MWVGIAFKETIKLPLNIEGKWSVEWTFRVDEPQTKSSRHHRSWHSASGGKWYIDLMEAERLRPSRTSTAAELLHTRRTGWINCDGTKITLLIGARIGIGIPLTGFHLFAFICPSG